MPGPVKAKEAQFPLPAPESVMKGFLFLLGWLGPPGEIIEPVGEAKISPK